MLHTLRVYPKISAYHVLEGVQDFNTNPWAPPSTKGTILNPPETRSSWGARSVDVWYLHPAWNYYICLIFIDTATGGIKISGQYTLYPQHFTIPIERPMDEAMNIEADLIQ